MVMKGFSRGFSVRDFSRPALCGPAAFRRLALSLFLLTPGLVLAPCSIRAETFLSAEEIKKLPPEIAERASRMSIEKAVAGVPTFAPVSERAPDWVNSLPITLHLRGTAGKPLPEAEKLREERRQARRQTRSPEERVRQATAEHRAMMSRYNASRQMKPLPACHRDTKHFTPFASPLRRDVIQDLLFVKPGESLTDSDEQFGQLTQVIPYDPSRPSNWAMYGKNMGITCLPTRLRILGKGLSREEGLPALRNYDTEPYGKGELKDSVKSRTNRLYDEQGGSL